MPIGKSTVHSLQSTVKRFLVAIVFLVIPVVLSGCSAVGSNKPAALQITTNPESAVFLDGKHLGKTPFFSDQLKEGEYTLKISASEASFSQKIKLTPSTLTVVNRDLNNNYFAQAGETLWLDPGKKGLFISSNPNEVDVAIDGKNVGKTPLLLEKTDPGDRKITLTKVGYITREFAIKTSKNSQLFADVNLASEAAKGIAATSSSPLPSPVKVQILATPQGFLRVRKDPALSGVEIGRVKPGDELELIQETKDWYQIKFIGGIGWISSQFAKKL